MRNDKNKVLVIEDGAGDRVFMSDLLKEAGFEVFTQASPIGATRLIVSSGIQCVILDIKTPARRGDKLATLFRDNHRFRDLGVILVSGAPLDELRRVGVEVGANAVVERAAVVDSLVSTVQNVLDSRA